MELYRKAADGSLSASGYVSVPDAAWALNPIVMQRKEKFPLFARLLAAAYDDAEFTPEEAATLKWEAGQLRTLVKSLRGPLRMGELTASPEEVMQFLAEVRRLADESASRGEGIFAEGD